MFEMKPYLVREDLDQWLPLIGWLAQRKPLHIAPGTPAMTSAVGAEPSPIARCAAACAVGDRAASRGRVPADPSAPAARDRCRDDAAAPTIG